MTPHATASGSAQGSTPAVMNTGSPTSTSAAHVQNTASPSTVSVTQFTDPSGAAGLRVVTDGANDNVTITENNTGNSTTVVANGKTTNFNQLFTAFDLQLMSKQDNVTFNPTSSFNGQTSDIGVNLGTGQNHFTFNPNQTAITNNSDVNLNIQGHGGTDFTNVSFGQILESTVSLTENNLGGTTAASSTPNDTITFGVGKTGVRNSAVDVNVGLGHGTNNLALNYGIDLGHLAPPSGTPAAASDFGPSTMNVNITGSNRPQDSANVTLNATGEVNTASTLNFSTRFQAGNNNFNAIFDANTFQIDDDGGAFINGPGGTTAPHSGGAAHFNVQGGTGNDNISFKSINQNSTIELSGLFDINATAGSGRDNLNVNFGGPGGFTDDDPFEKVAINRDFRLRLNGGAGIDQMNVNLTDAATSTFANDIAIQGGTGKNTIAFTGVDLGNANFGPAGHVRIDGGGAGHSHTTVAGNFKVQTLNTTT
jgi:hypothetical protein